MDGAALTLDIGLTETPAPNADSALVRRAASGDTAAFEQLYRSHVGRVHGVILRLLGMDRARAEELTQEAFVRAWQKLDSYRHESAFSTWLHRLGVNTALMELRGRRDEQAMADDELQAAAGGEMPFCAAERADLERAVSNLPPRARAVLVLHELEGYTHKELSDLFGQSESYSKSILARALKKLGDADEPGKNSGGLAACAGNA